MNNIRDATQQQIIDSLQIPCHGLLNLAPRVGKTKICIGLLKKQNPNRILWVTPSTKLRDVDIPNEFKKWGAEDLLYKTDIVCYKSLYGMFGEYDVIILDEYQYITDNNMEGILDGPIKYNNIIGLSGTHPKHWDKQLILDTLNLKILYRMGINEAVSKGLIADYTINIIECQLDSANKYIKAGNKNKSWLQTEKEAYKYMTDNIFKPFMIMKRMRFIYDSPVKEEVAIKLLSTLNGRKVVFCSSIAQAERLGNGNTYHSKTKDVALNRFMNNESTELYCVQSGGTGFTFSDVDDFVIIQTTSDKGGETTQRLARSLLSQAKEYKGNIWFLCLVDTKDNDWLNEALKGSDETRIKRIKSSEL